MLYFREQMWPVRFAACRHASKHFGSAVALCYGETSERPCTALQFTTATDKTTIWFLAGQGPTDDQLIYLSEAIQALARSRARSRRNIRPPEQAFQHSDDRLLKRVWDQLSLPTVETALAPTQTVPRTCKCPSKTNATSLQAFGSVKPGKELVTLKIPLHLFPPVGLREMSKLHRTVRSLPQLLQAALPVQRSTAYLSCLLKIPTTLLKLTV